MPSLQLASKTPSCRPLFPEIRPADDIMLSMIFVAFAAVGLVFSVMIQTMTAGRSRAVEMGLGSVAAKCLYAFVPIACVTAAALVYQLGGFQEIPHTASVSSTKKLRTSRYSEWINKYPASVCSAVPFKL